MKSVLTIVFAMSCFTSLSNGEETFVTIHKVSGQRMLVAKDDSGNRGRGMRGRVARAGQTAATGRMGMERGRRGEDTTQLTATVTVPKLAKITSAMRERRTFEFRVLAELPGGLRHRTFREMKTPLQARIVTKNNIITEINVITGETDINQSGTDANGQAVIAVRPKRPPMKRKP